MTRGKRCSSPAAKAFGHSGTQVGTRCNRPAVAGREQSSIRTHVQIALGTISGMGQESAPKCPVDDEIEMLLQVVFSRREFPQAARHRRRKTIGSRLEHFGVANRL